MAKELEGDVVLLYRSVRWPAGPAVALAFAMLSKNSRRVISCFRTLRDDSSRESVG